MKRSRPAIVAAIAGIVVIGLVAFVSITPRGLVSPPTGLVLKAAAFLSAGKPVSWDVADRRVKNLADAAIISRVVRGPVAVERATATGPRGDLPLRVYRRTDLAPNGVVLLFHGGGYVVGNLDTSESFARSLCLESRAAVVSVDYRLAPEHPFPAAVEDVLAAYEWALARVEDSFLPSGGVFVTGDSAGATLSTVLCLEAKRLGLPQPRAQILFYPATDVSRLDTESYDLFATDYILTREEMAWFVDTYLPNPSDRIDPRASPLLAPDLSGLPEALVVTAAFDVLRDEGEAYAARLRDAGVAIHARRVPGVIHGFVSMSRFEPAAEAELRRAGKFIRERAGR